MKFTRRDKKTELEKEIDDIVKEMRNGDVFSEEYEHRLNIVERLIELKDDKSKKKISPDTIVIVAANLLGIALILGFEKANVITTKALGFVMRGRV